MFPKKIASSNAATDFALDTVNSDFANGILAILPGIYKQDTEAISNAMLYPVDCSGLADGSHMVYLTANSWLAVVVEADVASPSNGFYIGYIIITSGIIDSYTRQISNIFQSNFIQQSVAAQSDTIYGTDFIIADHVPRLKNNFLYSFRCRGGDSDRDFE